MRTIVVDSIYHMLFSFQFVEEEQETLYVPVLDCQMNARVAQPIRLINSGTFR